MSILKSRPQYYPLHDLLDTNSTAPEDSLYRQSGYPTGLPVPSSDHNGKFRSLSLWAAYVDGNHIYNADWLSPTLEAALSSTSLTYNTGGNVLTTGATVATRGAYLINGGRFETDDAFLNPVGAANTGSPLIYPTATVPGRIWVYADADGDVRIASVSAGTADAPTGTEITLVGIDVDAGGVVTDGAVAPSTLPLPAHYLPVATDVVSTADLTAVSMVCLDLNAGGDGTAPSGTAIIAEGNGTNGVAVSATGAGTQAGIVAAGDGAGSGSAILANNANGAACIDANGLGGNSQGLNASGDGSGAGVYATSDTGVGVDGYTSGSSSPGVRGTSHTTSPSVGVQGICTNNSAYGVYGQNTHASATVNAIGVYGTSGGSGTGVKGRATSNGYGIVAQADGTRAPFRIVPQTGQPASPAQGDVSYDDSTALQGQFIVRHTGGWQACHTSPLGYVEGLGAGGGSGSTAGGPATMDSCQMQPEKVGDVVVHGTAHLDWTIDTGDAQIDLYDSTAAAVIAGPVNIRAVDTDGAGPNRGTTVTLRAKYTVPNTNNRTFQFRVTSVTGTVTYDEAFITARGVY